MLRLTLLRADNVGRGAKLALNDLFGGCLLLAFAIERGEDASEDNLQISVKE